MHICKHSYISTKNKEIVLCVIAKDKNYLYGEITYGKKPAVTSKKKILGGIYYKYWEIQGRFKTKTGKNHIRTKYINYYRKVKALYPQYAYSHEVIGPVFRINKESIGIKWIPSRAKSHRAKLIVNEISKLLNVEPKNILIGGSNMFNRNALSENDFDIVLKGKRNIKNAISQINKLIKNEKHALFVDENKIHQRRFRIKNTIICPFGIDPSDNILDNAPYRKIENEKIINGEVIDDSNSLLLPAIYTLKNKEIGKFLLVSYCVGHQKLFSKGDFVSLEAPVYKTRKLKYPIVIVPVQGLWIEKTPH